MTTDTITFELTYKQYDMKKQFYLLKRILFLSATLYSSYVNGQTADTSASQTTKCVLQYISGLSSQTNNKVISGQWMNNRGLPETPFTEFDTVITSLYNQTNKWVGIIGTNYTRTHTSPYYIAIENMYQVNQPLISYFNNNGLVAVMTNFKNPWNQTNSNDLTNSSNLLDVVTNGHPANTNFNKELDSLAKGFSQLQDSGVTVLFRPFHEMNGNWFWWGSKSATLPVASDFIRLWKYVFDYLTVTKNLHNILWVFAPSAKETGVGNPAFKTELFYYPGSSYVDIIGLDVYNDTLDIPNYSALVSTGKPLGLAEFGQRKPTIQNNPHVYDYTILLNQIKVKYPALCFWLSWNHFKNNNNDWLFYSMTTQNNTSTLLNDSWVANREDIDYSNCLTTSIDELISKNGGVTIFPNPFSMQTVIHSSSTLNNASLTIYNSFGQPVNQIKNITGQTVTFSRENLPSGLYFVQLTNNHQIVATKKIIITD